MLEKLDVHIRYSGSDLLLDRWMQFSGGNDVTIHSGYGDWHEAGVYLADIIDANRGKVIVNCDIDRPLYRMLIEGCAEAFKYMSKNLHSQSSGYQIDAWDKQLNYAYKISKNK